MEISGGGHDVRALPFEVGQLGKGAAHALAPALAQAQLSGAIDSDQMIGD